MKNRAHGAWRMEKAKEQEAKRKGHGAERIGQIMK